MVGFMKERLKKNKNIGCRKKEKLVECHTTLEDLKNYSQHFLLAQYPRPHFS